MKWLNEKQFVSTDERTFFSFNAFTLEMHTALGREHGSMGWLREMATVALVTLGFSIVFLLFLKLFFLLNAKSRTESLTDIPNLLRRNSEIEVQSRRLFAARHGFPFRGSDGESSATTAPSAMLPLEICWQNDRSGANRHHFAPAHFGEELRASAATWTDACAAPVRSLPDMLPVKR